MSVAEVAKAIQDRDWVAILIVLLVGVPVVAKGIFAVVTSRDRRRKEFLELWRGLELSNDALWLEETIKHRYGGALPSTLIRHVLTLRHPSERLRRLAPVSEFFELDARQAHLNWTKPYRARRLRLFGEIVGSGLAYFVLALSGGLVLWSAVKSMAIDGLFPAVLGGSLIFIAIRAMLHAMALVEAHSVLSFVNSSSRSASADVSAWSGSGGVGDASIALDEELRGPGGEVEAVLRRQAASDADQRERQVSS